MARKQSESGFYHVFSRGVGKQIIFEADADRKAFLAAVIRGLKSHDVELYAWCLMDNHFHLLVRGDIDEVGSLMKLTLELYARAFNKRAGRSGHLFQSRYGSEPVHDDAYFLQAVRYIHQNPEKAGIAKLDSYRWSSYREYVGTPKITQTDLALDMLGSVEAFIAFHERASDFELREYDDGKGDIGAKRAYRIALEEIGEDGVRSMRSLPQVVRDQQIIRLRGRGLSIRQIERLTGISRSTIERAIKQSA